MSRLVRIPEIQEILREAGEYNTWPGEESNAKMLQALEEGRQWMAEHGIEESGDYSSTYYWAWYWRLHGAWLFNKAEYAAALQDFEHALALSESIERERATSIALQGMGNCLHNLNRFKESVAVLERALQLCNTLGDPQDEVSVRNSLGQALTSMGDYEKAIHVLEQGMAASKQLPHPFGTYRLTLSKGVVHVHVGEHKEAYSQFLKAWATLRDHDAEPDPRIFQNLATTCIYMHDLDRANMWLEMLENNDDRALTQDPGIRLTKAELQLAREPTLQHALALLEQVANSRHEASLDVLNYSITAALHVLIEYQEFEKAASVIEQWHPEFLDAGLYQGDFNMRVASAMMEVATTRSTKAMELLNELIEEASRSQHHIEHERLLHAQTDLLLALGEHEKAVHSMKEAMDVRDQNQRRTSADLAALALIEHEQEQLNAVTDKQKVLLESFMPKAIVKRLMRGESEIADAYDTATVIFMDIVGFTTAAAKLEPRVLTRTLDKIFQRFDEVCQEYGVTKIKTIGDAYMVVSFEDVERAARATLAMNDLRFDWPDGTQAQFRFGLHCGPLIAGVIGRNGLQYDVWGDTVNVASRTESTSEPGKIQISEAVAHSLTSHSSFHLTERGEVNVKGKGTMTTYWLE